MSFEPDASQRKVLDAPPSARRVVVAGPGAGKTATSVLLIESIAQHQKIDPDGESVVYLSFSRAAVQAALDAFGERIDDLDITVSAMTLDSLAWQLDEPGAVGGADRVDFDAVVRRAARQLMSDYQGDFDEVVHLIVDEGQDFSRPRRELLAAVIDRLPPDAGFTVFGDPLQSIYDFFDDETEESEPAWDQVVAIAERAGAEETLTLDGSHRARRRGPRKVVDAGSAMRAVPRSARLELLDELVSDLTSIDNAVLPTTVERWTGSSAVLCRTNAESIRAFDLLARSGVSCSWRRGGETRTAIDRWVAELWNAVDGQPVPAGDFAEFAEHHPGVDRGLFRTLLATTGSRGSAIDWGAMARLCSVASAVETPWLSLRRAQTETSTVHQSKGLEWDNVVVVDASSMLRPRDGVPPQPELLFVGLSRAAEKVVTASSDNVFMRRDFGGGLWYRPHLRTRRATAVCMTPDHLDGEMPVGGDEARCLLASLELPARMHFQLLRAGHADHPTYRCMIDGTAVGITSSAFGRDLVHAVKGRSADDFPTLGSVMVEGVETRWSTSRGTRFWLSPRPLGVAQIGVDDDA